MKQVSANKIVEPTTITNEQLYEEIEELLAVMNEIKEQQVEIIEKLNDLNISGEGFRTFNIDEN